MENTTDQKIIQSKDWRKRLDDILQEMKAELEKGERGEHVRHLCQSRTNLEYAIMDQGMRLKALNTPNPYPNSYDASNTKVEPTADGLKL